MAREVRRQRTSRNWSSVSLPAYRVATLRPVSLTAGEQLWTLRTETLVQITGEGEYPQDFYLLDYDITNWRLQQYRA